MLRALQTSQSGHPGGSLSSLDILLTLYLKRIRETNEPVIVSNGHISPAVYSVLSALGVADAEEFMNTFRQIGSAYEGHVSRTVPGVWYGTGPLGSGFGAAVGVAMAQKMKGEDQHTFCLIGDGEAQEGIIHEAFTIAAKEDLNNLIVFCDGNKVQLTDSLKNISDIDIRAIAAAHGWHVLTIDGHDPVAIDEVLNKRYDPPVLVYAETIMGYGVPELEDEGRAHKATWHGKTPKRDEIEIMIKQFVLGENEMQVIKDLQVSTNNITTQVIHHDDMPEIVPVDTGIPIVYDKDVLTDCRSAYGKALLSMVERNKCVVAMTADLAGSVKMNDVKQQFPEQFIECGIAEQGMVAMAGGLTVKGMTPFVSTFGVFLTSRAKCQARLNDINKCNVKMVATHCGLSVGEDGPTHQAVDDLGSMAGLLNTRVMEPCDPNHCDRMIRFAAAVNGPVYVRMGRHKLPVITKENGDIFFDANYNYEYGKTELIRSGAGVTVICSGPIVHEALTAREKHGMTAEIVMVSSPKKFDETLIQSVLKNQHVIVVEDHNPHTGYGAGVAKFLLERGLTPKSFTTMGVTEYQLSGKPHELYKSAGISAEDIARKVVEIRH